MKRFLFFFLSLILTIQCVTLGTLASDGDPAADPVDQGMQTAADLMVDARGAILIEASTGSVLFEQNADEAFPPASVTKIMTLLLVMEALDSGRIKWTDPVPVSEYAASMGGSQVFLSPGETLSVEDMVKCTVISSANDAAVAIAEFLSGSEATFVSDMNRRAEELGMKNAHFENVTGLDDTTIDHRCSARDIAIMSRELIRHKDILKYSSIWMDSIRGGAFTLSNTNRLIRFYSGATGLKTGSTAKAKFCLSATAERNGMTLIAVVMGSPSRDVRNEEAKRLLDYGFSSYSLYVHEPTSLTPLKVPGGVLDRCSIVFDRFETVVNRGEADQVKVVYILPDSLPAPVSSGDIVGKVVFRLGEKVIGESPIRTAESVARISYPILLYRLFRSFVMA